MSRKYFQKGRILTAGRKIVGNNVIRERERAGKGRGNGVQDMHRLAVPFNHKILHKA